MGKTYLYKLCYHSVANEIAQRCWAAQNDNFVIFVNFWDASTRSKNFRLLFSVCQIENFCIGPDNKFEENKDIKTRNRSLRLIKGVSKCVFLILFTK